MKLIELKDISPEQLKSLGEQKDLTAEERAQVIRLVEAELAGQELDRPEGWAPTTPVEDLLTELEAEQRRWEEQHP